MLDHARLAIRQYQIRGRRQERVELELNGSGDQLAGSGPKYISQWIVNPIGPTQVKNVATLGHRRIALHREGVWQA